MEHSAADSLKNIVDAKYIYAALQVEHWPQNMSEYFPATTYSSVD